MWFKTAWQVGASLHVTRDEVAEHNLHEAEREASVARLDEPIYRLEPDLPARGIHHDLGIEL